MSKNPFCRFSSAFLAIPLQRLQFLQHIWMLGSYCNCHGAAPGASSSKHLLLERGELLEWSPRGSPSLAAALAHEGWASSGYLLPLSSVPLKDRGRHSCTFAPDQAVPSKHHTAGFKFLNCGGN